MDETHSHPPPPRVSNLPLVMLPMLHLAAGGMSALFWSAPFSHDRDWPITTVIGLALSQALLCSYGAALVRGRLVWRWPASALLVGLASGFAMFCLSGIDPRMPDNVATLLTAALFALWLAAQVPLWILRLRFHWCITRGRVAHLPLGREELQFGIKHLLGWTAAVAVLCAVGRLAFSSISLRSAFGETRPLAIFTLLVAFSTLLSVLPLWAGLARHQCGPWWMLTLIYSTVVISCEPWVLNLVLNERRDDGAVFWWLGFVEVASLLGSLFLMRAAGYRLVRLSAQDAAHGR